MWPGPKKSDQTKEEDCALWWELFPQPWSAKLLHTKVTFLWLCPQLNIHHEYEYEAIPSACVIQLVLGYLCLPWNYTPGTKLSNKMPPVNIHSRLCPRTNAFFSSLFEDWIESGELSVSGKYWLSLIFELNLLQLATQTWPELDVLGFFCGGM